MRLKNITLRGVTQFIGAEPVSIDFDAIGPGLVAVVGKNGAGKTSFLEALPAALYGRFPSRPGSLYPWTHGHDAFIEAQLQNGADETITVRVQVDADREQTERYIFINGQPITTGRAKEYEAEVERRFGSMRLFLGSAFSAQEKGGNFLKLDRKDRKDFLAELLMLGDLAALAERAKARRSAAETDLAVIRARILSLEGEVGRLDAAERAETDAKAAAEAAAGKLATAREEEAAALSALDRAHTAAERIAGLRKATDVARDATEAAAKALLEAQELQPRAEREAERRRRALTGQDPDAMEQRARTSYERGVEARKARRETYTRLVGETAEVQAAAQRLEKEKAEQRDLRARVEQVRDYKHKRALAEQAADAADKRLLAAEDAAGKEIHRLNLQAERLEQVPCTQADEWIGLSRAPELGPAAMVAPPQETANLAGTCPLLADARTAKLAIGSVRVDPAAVTAAAQAALAFDDLRDEALEGLDLDDLSRRLDALTNSIGILTAKAARAGEIQRAHEALAGLDREDAEARGTLHADLAAAQKVRETIAAEQQSIATDLADALVDARLKLTAAEATALEAAHAYATAMEAWDAALAEGTTVPAAEAIAADAKKAREAAEAALREADRAWSAATTERERLQGQALALEGARTEDDAVGRDVSEWQMLETALGRDGAQALEIDAAGPEVSRLTNELLAACYSTRFSLTLETLREKKSGGFSEVLDVRVFDGGQERPVEGLSGGEKVVVAEALGLAIAILNARKSGVQWRTLFRDETAGALDPDNAQAYVTMLRRAMALGGFEQVLFVSHSPDVWQRADARLVVEGGRIRPEAA